MKKGIIVGKSVRPYTAKNGEEKVARTLYVLWDEPQNQQDGDSGQKTEDVFCRFPIDYINLHDYCGFEYEIMPGKNGSIAVLTGITVLGPAKVTIERPKL